jgi:hypothetical protein
MASIKFVPSLPVKNLPIVIYQWQYCTKHCTRK